MKLIYNGTTKGGEFKIFRRAEFLEDVLRVFFEKDIVITVEKKKRKRSLQQNAYYWSVVVPICKEGLIDLGYRVTIDETHETLKSMFLKKELVNENTGEILEINGSTTEQSTSEFMDYLAQIQQWATEYLNTYIPDPGEELKFEL